MHDNLEQMKSEQVSFSGSLLSSISESVLMRAVAMLTTIPVPLQIIGLALRLKSLWPPGKLLGTSCPLCHNTASSKLEWLTYAPSSTKYLYMDVPSLSLSLSLSGEASNQPAVD